MNNLKLLLLFCAILLGVSDLIAQTPVSFDPVINTGTHGSSILTSADCNGQIGWRLDDGLGATTSDASAVWCNSTTIDLNQSFETKFNIRFGDVNEADGLTFTMQNQGLMAIGGGGGWLGAATSWGGSGISPSVNIEFDIFNNGSVYNDIAANHIAMSYNGNLAAPVNGPFAYPFVSNQWHGVTVNWDACTHTLTLNIDGGPPEMIHTDDLINNVFGGASSGIIFGFTSGTWSSNTTHDICFLSHEVTYCSCDHIEPPNIFLISGSIISGLYTVDMGITHFAGNVPTNVVWDWGDGTKSYTNTHTYYSPGTYFVRAIVQYQLLSAPYECCIKEVEFIIDAPPSAMHSPLKPGSKEHTFNTNSAQLYPNPIEKGEELTIQLEKVLERQTTFTVISMEGKKIMGFTSGSSSTLKVMIPKSMSSGLYIVTSNNNQIRPHKFYVTD